MAELLTSLVAVKAWLETGSDSIPVGDEPLITALIGQASRFITDYLNADSILPMVATERYDGSGGSRLMLRRAPVMSVSSLLIGGTSIVTAADQFSSGVSFEPWNGRPPASMQWLDLSGSSFARGRSTISVTYRAGYEVVGEAQTVAAGAVTASQAFGPWGSDEGVTYASGTALVKVAGTPAVGQYQLSASVPGGYVFNASDNGASVLLRYGFIPADVAHAATEIVGERYRYRQRIGQASKSVAGEVILFSLKDMQDYIRTALNPYMRVVPV